MDPACQDGQAPRGSVSGVGGGPKLLQAARDQVEGTAACTWPALCRAAGRPGPSPTGTAQINLRGPAASDHTLCVWFRKTEVHLPNSGYNPDCSGLFFLPFPNRIWACSLKGEVVLSDWPGPSSRSQETAPTSHIAQRVTGSASLS